MIETVELKAGRMEAAGTAEGVRIGRKDANNAQLRCWGTRSWLAGSSEIRNEKGVPTRTLVERLQKLDTVDRPANTL